MSWRRAACAVFLATALALGCGSALTGPPPPRQRAVLISLDGASAFELWNLHRAGQFSAGGFERFFADGEVAKGLVEIDPPMTSPSHISLITGHGPDRTGIVGNWFHIPGEPLLQQHSGFAAPIAAETLWEAARRQRLRVGVMGWPGADDTGPRRRGDWGMSYTDVSQRPPRTVVLGTADFSAPADGGAPVHILTLPPRGPGNLPALVAATALLAPASPERLELTALDRTDNGRRDFDALSLRTAGGGAGAVLVPGVWSRLWLPALEGTVGEPSAHWVRLGRLEPDLSRVELYLGPIHPTPAYPVAFARRLAAAEIAWPGAPDGGALERTWRGEPGLELEAWLEQSERAAGFFVDAMLMGIGSQEWDLLLGYLPSIDEAGHQFLLEDPRQVAYSPERAAEFAAARARVWRAVDRQMARLLAAIDLDSTTVMLVSDHGMAPVHSMVDPNLALVRAGWQVLDQTGNPAATSRAAAAENGGHAHVYLNLSGREPGGNVPAEAADDAIAELRQMFLGLRAEGEPVIREVFSRAEAGAIGLDHPHSGDLVLRAAPGYWFGRDRKRWRRPDGTLADAVLRSGAELGKHGFPSGEPRMHGIALALGAQAERGRPGLVPALSVAPRVARWLGIEPPRALAP